MKNKFITAVIAAGFVASAGMAFAETIKVGYITCLLYTSPSPRDVEESRMPSSA